MDLISSRIIWNNETVLGGKGKISLESHFRGSLLIAGHKVSECKALLDTLLCFALQPVGHLAVL